jgi:hypothetical protein
MPRSGAVVLEQIRSVGFPVRWAGLFAAAMGLLTTLLATDFLRTGRVIHFHPEYQMLPGLIGLTMPIAIWKGVARFGPSLFWTFPVDRRWHALSRVLAGWVVLIAIVAVFVVLQLALTLFTGGDLLADETLRVLLSLSTSTRGALDLPMQTVRWTPTPLFWLVPFTAATGTYVMSSAVALGLRDPLRWTLSVVLGLLVVFAIGDVVNAEWLSGGLVSVLQTIFAGPYGLDALLTARTESLKNEVLLAGGDVAVIWSGLPDVGEWAVATLLWTSAGLVALAAAVSRHRESR